MRAEELVLGRWYTLTQKFGGDGELVTTTGQYAGRTEMGFKFFPAKLAPYYLTEGDLADLKEEASV